MNTHGPVRPGEPTYREVVATGAWLARHGALTRVPTRLIAVRVGARSRELAPILILTAVLYFCLTVVKLASGDHVLFHVYRELLIAAVFAVWLLVRGQGVWNRDALAGHPNPPGDRPRAAAGLLGGWYFASLAWTFAGGAALYAALAVTRPEDRTGALLSLAILAVGLVPAARVLFRAFFARVIAEDEPSAAVDGVVRAQDAHVFALPALFAVLAAGNAWTSWVVVQGGHAVIAVGTQLTAWLLFGRRPLPPGAYGLPFEVGGGAGGGA
ncbi:hypothetical protein H4696_007999 [Amycolatopsis lexingtonensis]|uniref:Uncharacterized protein n=1 Tax=Amycolatopsis lexingtonensis TaxID=218822 RepID=A0ABR9ICJ0_9PSEU|nr:hypothetical protein [Amycolatopsis lexingtonensis]MBE1500899.1 hypothetical protein [Amycolatopsis lexingtonensis]